MENKTVTPALFTLFKSRHRLTKHYAFDDSGKVIEHAGAHVEGMDYTVALNSIRVFAERIQEMQGHFDWCICSGVSPYERARVTRAAMVQETQENELPEISRSKEHFTHRDGPGLFLGDYDGPPMSPEEYHAVLMDKCPWLNGVAMALTHSTGSWIRNDRTGEWITQAGGIHWAMLVDNARMIPQIVDAVFQATFASRGYAMIAKNGTPLPRGFIDRSCRESNRIIFESGASLGEGLSQHRPPPLIIPGAAL